MANFTETCRSNYFAVKNEAEFLQWAEQFSGVKVVTHREQDGTPLYALLMEDAGVPDRTSEDEDVDFIQTLSTHLKADEVAVIISVGHEAMRYMSGYAVAVNSRGETKELHLNNIYKLAETLTCKPKKVTRCEY